MAREQLDLLIDEKLETKKKSCYEAYTAWASCPILAGKLQETGMDRLFREVEMPLVFTLREMERAGVKVEAAALKAYGEQLGGADRGTGAGDLSAGREKNSTSTHPNSWV